MTWDVRSPSSCRGAGLLDVAIALWALFIVYGTTIPFRFTTSPGQLEDKVHALVEDPWQSPSRTDVIANVLLFVPWGVLVSARLACGGCGLPRAAAAATLGGLAVSALVEGAQLFLPSRTTSALDLVTNTLGSALGALGGWLAARWAWPRWRPIFRRVACERPFAALALAASVGLVFAGLSPYDVSLDVGDLKAAIKGARLVPFGPALGGAALPIEPWSWAGEALTWTAVGGLYALALREARRAGPGAIAVSAALGGALGLMIEALQVMIPGRAVDATSAVLAAAGAAVGAGFVQRYRRLAPRRWIAPALLIWSATAILSAWTPPDFTMTGVALPGWDVFVPFLSYYRRTDVYALADILGQVSSFVPLGAMLAAGRPRLSARGAATIGLGIGLALEAGQLFLPARTAEITDALSAAVGAAVGLTLWRWGESVAVVRHP